MSDRQAQTLLAHFLRWEQAQPDKVFLTQPYPDTRVVDYTWAEVGDQARRLAAHLRSRQQLGLDHARICFTGSAPLSPEIVDWSRPRR